MLVGCIYMYLYICSNMYVTYIHTNMYSPSFRKSNHIVSFNMQIHAPLRLKDTWILKDMVWLNFKKVLSNSYIPWHSMSLAAVDITDLFILVSLPDVITRGYFNLYFLVWAWAFIHKSAIWIHCSVNFLLISFPFNCFAFFPSD